MYIRAVQKIKYFLVIFLCVLYISPLTIQAQATSPLDTLIGAKKNCNYVDKGLYQPYSKINEQFPVFGSLVDRNGCIPVTSEVSDMFATGFKVFLGVVSLIAVVNISIAGIQWMITEKDTGKKRGAKKRLTDSIVGLILAMAGWVILSTVNPKLLDIGIDLKNTALGKMIEKGAQQAAGNIQPVEEGSCISGTTGCGKEGGTGTTGTPTVGDDYLSSGEDADFLRRKIADSGLTNLHPKDITDFFPDGQPTEENWLKLVTEIARQESGLKGNDLYAENFGNRPPAGTPGAIPLSEYPKNSKSGKLSIGMLSLSWDDPEVKRLGYTEQDLQDPVKNLNVGVEILKRTVAAGNCIACGTSNSASQSGAAAYWSVLRGDKKQAIINAMKSGN
ncbi:MAG: hypothetical protein V4576_03475 [Patescibacteria group bacterium]